MLRPSSYLYLSKTPVLDWQKACEPYVAYYHMNDNHGKLDKHLPLGEGIAPWEVFLPKMEKNVSVLIEVDSLEKYKKRVAFLEQVQKERSKS